jgi:hypothetical protein
LQYFRSSSTWRFLICPSSVLQLKSPII